MPEKFTGLQYPLIKGARGILAKKNKVDQIKADVLQLLLTNPGERVMLPNFGTPLRRLMFEQNDTILEQEARIMIANAMTAWEPRVVVTNITVKVHVDPSFLNAQDTGDEIEHILGISIRFVDPENISQVEELVLQLPIS